MRTGTAGISNERTSTANRVAGSLVGAAAGVVCAFLIVTPLAGQRMIAAAGRPVTIISDDLAVLEKQDVRKEITCSVDSAKPVLGFDLRFHAGFTTTVALKDLAGMDNAIDILFRVTPTNGGGEPVYFSQRFNVPSIEEGAPGDAFLESVVDLGEGKYHVDWLMRDRSQRVCSSYWDVTAELASRDREIPMEISSNTVEAASAELFTPEPEIQRSESEPLKIKVLVNFAPQNPRASTMRPVDQIGLVSILRRIVREPEFGRFSVVAFNMQEQRVLYRQESEGDVDFPALGEALKSVKLGVVDTRQLQNKHSDTEFLSDLIQTEMSAEDHPDALIFAGPKIMLGQNVPEDSLKPLNVDYPVFYLNYAVNPNAIPWRDAIGRTVRMFRGTEYTISRPRDLWLSFSEMVSRIVKSRQRRPLAEPASQ